jgi:hypothetical protein
MRYAPQREQEHLLVFRVAFDCRSHHDYATLGWADGEFSAISEHDFGGTAPCRFRIAATQSSNNRYASWIGAGQVRGNP